MTLKGKLIAAQAPLFAALALLTGLSLGWLSRLGASSGEILQDNYRSVLAAQRMKEAVERIDDAAARYLLTGDQEPIQAQVKARGTVLERELQVQEGNITEPGEIDLTRRLRTDWEEAKRLLGGFPASPNARGSYFGRIQPAFERVRNSAEEILLLNQDAMVKKSDRAQALSQRLRTLALAFALLAGALGLWAAAALTRKAVRPLLVLQQAMRRVGEGDWEARAVVSGRDEIAILAEDFNRLAEQLHQYRKSSLGELLRVQQAAQASIDSLPEPVLVLGTSREVLSMNQAAGSLLGGAESVADLPPVLRSVVDGIHSHVLSGKGPYAPRGMEEAVPISGPSGERHLLASAQPLHDENGITTGVTVVLQDVTRFKRFDQIRNDVVSIAAHEFRTPLTSIRMAVHVCLEGVVGPLTPKQADLLSAAREDLERLQALVDDLLDLSRLQEGGSLAPEPRPVSASRLLSQALGRHRDSAEASSIKLLSQDFGEDLTVLADPERIGIVFDNLITNALRHTPAGGSVEVRARKAEGGVRFDVSDTGPGIPREHQERLFDRGYQVPEAGPGATRGMGLAIAKDVVLSHGGEIGVQSAAGQGSTFWFVLPQAKQA